MTVLAWLAATVAAGVHLLVFAWEVVLLPRPAVHHGVFGMSAADLPAVRLWAFGVGFYNLFLALGMLAGVVAWMAGEVDVGRALVVYIAAFMALSGVVLLVADRRAMGRPRGAGLSGAAGQGLPALVALVAALAA